MRGEEQRVFVALIGLPLRAPRLSRRERRVGFSDALVERGLLLLHPVGTILALVSSLGARLAGLRIDVQQQREVGLEAAAGDSVERQHGGRAEPPSAGLIRE